MNSRRPRSLHERRAARGEWQRAVAGAVSDVWARRQSRGGHSAHLLGLRKPPEGRGDLRRPGTKRSRARLAQFLFASVAPHRSDGRDPMPRRRNDIMLAVPQHHAVACIDPALDENMVDEFALVLEATAKFGAVGGFEIAFEIEMAQDSRRVNDGLRGAEKKARPRPVQSPQRLPDAVIDDCL